MEIIFYVLFFSITGFSIFCIVWPLFSKGPDLIEGKVLDLKKDKELCPSPVSELDPMPVTQFYIEIPIYVLKLKTEAKNIFYFKMTREDYEDLKHKKIMGKKIKILFSRDLTNLYLKEWYKI